ncbi:MAG: hypothetical protein DSY70_03025 [Desulfobulbus sp.]|nr:MAG: hypothetical protein DSY70_03025 [Desulfobulbus sp.]
MSEQSTGKDWHRLGADEQGQSSVFVALTAVVFIAFLILSPVVVVSPVYAGQVSLYHREGDALFARGRAVLIHGEMLREVVVRINNDQTITGLEISVTCPIRGGGRELAGKRCLALKRFFTQQLRRPLPIKLTSLEQKGQSDSESESTRKMMKKMGIKLTPEELDYANYWDFIDIAGTGGAGLSHDPIFYEIDQKISKLPAADPHVAILRQYRKILQTMADLEATTPHYGDPRAFLPSYFEISNSSDPRYGEFVIGSELREARCDYAECKEEALPLMVMAVKLSREVYQVALAIRQQHVLTHVPPYDEEIGIRALRAHHEYIRYNKDALNVARVAYQAFLNQTGCDFITLPDSYMSMALQGMGIMKTYQARRRFVREQVALNNFIREHLGLSLLHDYACGLPIHNILVLRPVRIGSDSYSSIRDQTMQEAVDFMKLARHKWARCGFPPPEKLERTEVHSAAFGSAGGQQKGGQTGE